MKWYEIRLKTFRKFAYICSVCKNPIVPKEGQTKAPRIRALDRDFHPQCFKCEVGIDSHSLTKIFRESKFVVSRTAVKFWTLALKDQSAGPYDIIFSAINVTEEDKVNPNLSQKSRRILILLGGPQCFPPIFVWRPFSIYDYFNWLFN